MIVLVVAVFNQSALIGWWRGEAKYKGRYTNSWRAELRTYKYRGHAFYGCWGGSDSMWFFEREPSKWEEWLGCVLPKGFPSKRDSAPPLQDGDPNAIRVLIELLEAPEQNVRIQAANALERTGEAARDAIPALLAMLKIQDWEAALAAREAVRAIDPKFDE
jgi:hypothetical protein